MTRSKLQVDKMQDNTELINEIKLQVYPRLSVHSQQLVEKLIEAEVTNMDTLKALAIAIESTSKHLSDMINNDVDSGQDERFLILKSFVDSTHDLTEDFRDDTSI